MRKSYMLLFGAVGLLIFSFFVAAFSAMEYEPWSEKVAIIQLHGGIESTVGRGIDPESVIKLIDSAESNPGVKAILFDINSPGGTPVGSDEIANAIKKVEKPTVAWIGDVGASGAYWIASASDKVVAHRMSITGSIGAYTTLIVVSGMMDKLGIQHETLQSGLYKDVGNPFRNVTEADREIFSEMVNETYDEFVKAVAENRGLGQDYVYSIADGRPYSGKKAHELGLVDELGNRADAIALAGELGGIEGEPGVVVLAPKKQIFAPVLTEAFSDFGYGIAQGFIEALRT